MPHQLLLDTSSLLYRAFFALPHSISDSDGQPVNALHGYLDMTANLLRDQRPDALIHVFDHDWRPAARIDAYPAYKADRAADPESVPAALQPQFDQLPALLDALGQTRAEAKAWEADDAIGALCHQATSGDKVDVVTGDRDMLQLIHDGDAEHPTVRVLYTVRGVSELAEFDAAAVEEKYGVPPSRYVDFATLRGDPSDGLPGVPGIGEKTAAKLIAQYESLDALLDAAEQEALTPKLSENLRHSRDYLAAMRLVVPIQRDVEVVVTRSERDEPKLAALAEKSGLTGPVGRLTEAAA